MPALAEQIARKAEDGRYITVERDYLSYAGNLRVHGVIDMADALDLDDALARGAEQLKQDGCTLPLEARRALALGILARGELTTPVVEEVAQRTSRDRNLNLYLHLAEDDPTTATVENDHRLATHAGWTYKVIRPGTYELTPPLVESPRRRAA